MKWSKYLSMHTVHPIIEVSQISFTQACVKQIVDCFLCFFNNLHKHYFSFNSNTWVNSCLDYHQFEIIQIYKQVMTMKWETMIHTKSLLVQAYYKTLNTCIYHSHIPKTYSSIPKVAPRIITHTLNLQMYLLPHYH